MTLSDGEMRSDSPTSVCLHIVRHILFSVTVVHELHADNNKPCLSAPQHWTLSLARKGSVLTSTNDRGSWIMMAEIMPEGYALRPRKRRVVIQAVESTDSGTSVTDHFRVEDEARAWDAFYTNNEKSDEPFSGFGTKATVSMIRTCLRRLWSPPLINKHDIILEVGHGKHPLLWDLQRAFGAFRHYTGIEFSRGSVHEAIKLRERLTGKDPLASTGDNVEFLCATNVKYFNSDGSCNAEVVFPSEESQPWLRAGAVTLLFAKSTLDYITCRLTGSVDSMDWEDQPRIAPSVVEMFDSLSLALDEPSAGRVPTIIFVEPGYDGKTATLCHMLYRDFVKFRDHIATIVRVIYSATFRTKSPAKWLRLTLVRRYKNHKAVCYTLQKTQETYECYADLRADIYRVTSGLYELSSAQDDDWLLPINVPPKWNSVSGCDLEQLSAI